MEQSQEIFYPESLKIAIMENKHNTFVKSCQYFFETRGFLTEKQIRCLRNVCSDKDLKNLRGLRNKMNCSWQEHGVGGHDPEWGE